MIESIRSYMDDQITAFQFDEDLTETCLATSDETVRWVANEVWFYYDDLREHYIVASRAVWNYLNRLLLLLASDASIEAATVRREWHGGQLVAAFSLACFLCAAALVPAARRPELLALVIPLGAVSMAIRWWNARRRKRKLATARAELVPFTSIRSMFLIRRRTEGFVKKRYPDVIASRRIRWVGEEVLLGGYRILIWVILSPFVVLVQMFPDRVSEARVVTPDQECARDALSLHA